jgi:hypothetical protein
MASAANKAAAMRFWLREGFASVLRISIAPLLCSLSKWLTWHCRHTPRSKRNFRTEIPLHIARNIKAATADPISTP